MLDWLYWDCPAIPTRSCSLAALRRISIASGKLLGLLSSFLYCSCVRSRATSGRSAINPDGNSGYGFVHAGTVLLIRAVFIILVVATRNCVWLLEQPSSSCVMDHCAIEWLMERAPEAQLRQIYSSFGLCHWQKPETNLAQIS